MGLLGARNAGIEVPDDCMEKSFDFYRQYTSADGTAGYDSVSGRSQFGIGTYNRSAIATLVFAIGKKKHWKQYGSTRKFVLSNTDYYLSGISQFYQLYYTAQALFQIDIVAWRNWNRSTIARVQKSQHSD